MITTQRISQQGFMITTQRLWGQNKIVFLSRKKIMDSQPRTAFQMFRCSVLHDQDQVKRFFRSKYQMSS